MQKQLLVLIPALRARSSVTIEVARELQENGLNPESCYTDPDLGPALRSDAFQAFRIASPSPRHQSISIQT